MRPTARLTLAALAVTALVAGCSSDDSATAEERVCDARAQLQSSVDQVKQDVSERNLGQAKEDLEQVGSDLDTLASAQADLADDKRAQVEPMVSQLQETLDTLSDADSLAELGATLSTALSQMSEVLGTISTTVDCS